MPVKKYAYACRICRNIYTGHTAQEARQKAKDCENLGLPKFLYRKGFVFLSDLYPEKPGIRKYKVLGKEVVFHVLINTMHLPVYKILDVLTQRETWCPECAITMALQRINNKKIRRIK